MWIASVNSPILTETPLVEKTQRCQINWIKMCRKIDTPLSKMRLLLHRKIIRQIQRIQQKFPQRFLQRLLTPSTPWQMERVSLCPQRIFKIIWMPVTSYPQTGQASLRSCGKLSKLLSNGTFDRSMVSPSPRTSWNTAAWQRCHLFFRGICKRLLDQRESL